MNRILLGIIVALVIGLGITGWFLKHEVGKVSSVQAELKASQDSVKQLNKELQQKVAIGRATDVIVDDIRMKDMDVETKISTIQETVKTTAKKEAKGEISPSTASSVYIDSMWRAYCQAGIPNPRCASE